MIKINNIDKQFGQNKVLNGFKLELQKNEIIALVGISGCGKTTLLRIVAGFEQPDKGYVEIDQKKASTPDFMIKPHERNISMIFQDLALWPHMNVEKHLIFACKNRQLTKTNLQTTLSEILESVKLSGYNKRYPHELSGGEKQRLSIARALSSRSNYLLMDEPFSSIDNILKDDLHKLIIKIKKDYHMGIIYVTHNIDDALHIADRIAIIQNGTIVQIDKGDALLNNPKNDFVHRMIQGSKR